MSSGFAPSDWFCPPGARNSKMQYPVLPVPLLFLMGNAGSTRAQIMYLCHGKMKTKLYWQINE